MRHLAALLALTLSASAQSTNFGGRNGDPGTLAAAAPEIRRAEPVVRPGVPAVRPVAGAPVQGGSAAGATFRVGDAFAMRLGGMPTEYANMYALEFTIGGDGYINLPLCGQIRAAGMTQSQLERAIEKRLIEEKIFTHPTAMISVPNQGRSVTVGGSVRSPNRQPWSPDLTLMVAIQTAGGPGDFSGDKIHVIRGGVITPYSFKKLRKNPADDPKLLPGDQVDFL